VGLVRPGACTVPPPPLSNHRLLAQLGVGPTPACALSDRNKHVCCHMATDPPTIQSHASILKVYTNQTHHLTGASPPPLSRIPPHCRPVAHRSNILTINSVTTLMTSHNTEGLHQHHCACGWGGVLHLFHPKPCLLARTRPGHQRTTYPIPSWRPQPVRSCPPISCITCPATPKLFLAPALTLPLGPALISSQTSAQCINA
jgi:hypothetical protein